MAGRGEWAVLIGLDHWAVMVWIGKVIGPSPLRRGLPLGLPPLGGMWGEC